MTLFPVLGLAAMVAALPGAVAGSPVLILPLAGSATIDAAVARAGGYPVGPVRAPFGRVVHSQDPAFLEMLRASGPFVLLNADQLPNFICGRYA